MCRGKKECIGAIFYEIDRIFFQFLLVILNSVLNENIVYGFKLNILSYIKTFKKNIYIFQFLSFYFVKYMGNTYLFHVISECFNK